MDDRLYTAYLGNLDFFQSKMEREPKSALHLPIAYIYHKLGQYSEAIEMCRKGLGENPEYSPLRVLLALCLIETGEKDEAREMLIDVVMDDEDNYKALKTLGWLYKSENKGADAVKYLKVAYVKAPEDEELLVWLNELGISLEHIRDAAEDSHRVGDDDDMFGEDEFNYNVDSSIDEARVAISAVLDNLSNLATAEPPSSDIVLESSSDSPEVSDDELDRLMAMAEAAKNAPPPPPEPKPEPDIKEDEQDFEAALAEFDKVTESIEPTAERMAMAAASLRAEDAVPFIPADLASNVYKEAGLDPNDPFGDEPIMIKSSSDSPEVSDDELAELDRLMAAAEAAKNGKKE